MSGVCDRTWSTVTLSLSVLITVLSVVPEVIHKTSILSPMVGWSGWYIYLGARQQDLNPTPWLLISCKMLIAINAAAMLVYRIIKRR